MSAEDKLIHSFYNGFWSFLVASIVFLILIVLIILCKSKLLQRFDNSKASNITYWIVITVMIIINVFLIYKFIVFCKDKKQVDNRNFITITGTVVGFDKKTFYDDGKPTYSNPIINIEETNKTIVLKLRDVNLYETYNIIYLENTHLAERK